MSENVADERPHRLRVPVSDADWVPGPTSAPVTLVEYLDYECEHCQAMYPVLERLFAEYRDRMRFVVRHFPVTSSHPRAMAAALAAEAAGRQGKFWPMHQRLFSNPGRLEPADLVAHARALRLDLKHFEDDMRDDALRRKIEAQKLEGLRSGVNGTPTLFLNGVRYDGPRTLEALEQAVEAAARRRR